MQTFELFDYFPNCHSPVFDWESHNRKFSTRNIIFRATTKAVEYPEHWGGLSVKTICTGEEYFFLEGERFVLSPEKFLILNDGQYYGSQVRSNTEVESFTINFTQQFVAKARAALLLEESRLIDQPDASPAHTIEFIQHFHRHDDIITPCIRLIYQLSQNFHANRQRIEEAYFYLLRALLQKQMGVQLEMHRTPGRKRATKEELFRRLMRGRDFVESNFHLPLSLQDMARVSCLSVYHFLESFRKLFGCTPYQYLTKVRLERAKIMLETSDVSVQQVCQQVGYEDISSFSKLYKKTFGISPSKAGNI